MDHPFLDHPFISEFAVPQTVRIKSRWLRMPEILTSGVLFFFFVCYKYIYKLDFMTVLDISAEVYLHNTGVQAEGAKCWEVSGKCTYAIPGITAYEYCSKDGDRAQPLNASSEDASGLIWPCVNPRERSVTFGRYNQGVTVGTSIAFRNGTQRYITAAERVNVLKLMARVTGPSWSSIDLGFYKTPGVLQYVGEEKPRRFALGEMKDLEQEEMPSWNTSELKYCGGRDSTNISVDQCYISFHATHLTLDTIMKAANVKMTDHSSFGNVRQFGTQLDLQIRFSNVDAFWRWPWGPKPQYTINPERTVFTVTNRGADPEESYRAFWVHDNGTSEEVLVRGIFVKPQVEAYVVEFRFLKAVTQLTIATLILSFAKLFVSTALTFVYGRVNSLEHISVMTHLARAETTMKDSEVREWLATADRTNMQRDGLFSTSIDPKLVKKLMFRQATLRANELVAVEVAGEDETSHLGLSSIIEHGE